MNFSGLTFRHFGRCLWTAAWLLVLTAFIGTPSVAATGRARFVPGQILVKPKAGCTEAEFTAKLGARGAQQRRAIHRSNVRVVNLHDDDVEAALDELRRDPRIEFAERDFLAEAAMVPNDPYVLAGNEWHLAKISAPAAWDITPGRSNVIVAVLDSGVNAAHPDLAGQIVPGYDFVWDDADAADDYGHGTAVAGVVAAAGNNGLGVAGVAFGCRVMPVKVMDASGFAAYSTLAQGIRYAVDNGARVINISIAGTATSATLQDAINYARSNNVVVVAAAGNNGNNTPLYPAACEYVVAVSATGADDALAAFSNFGSHIALAAPGESIWTTTRDLITGYSAWRGTSLASPIVASAAALVSSANSTLTATQVVAILVESSDDLGAAGFDESFGFGRVNLARAVATATGLSVDPPVTNPPPPVPPSPPTVAITAPTASAQIYLGSSLSVSVNASSTNALSGVTLLANGGVVASFVTPPFTVNWTPPGTGTFTLVATATDAAGLCATSAPVTVSVTTPPPPAPQTAVLSLQISGNGTVKPNLNGTNLTVGKVYTVTATPGAGQIFAGWSGVDSRSIKLSFAMQPGLALVANFVPNPFLNSKGAYNGLIWNTNSVAPESSGSFTLNLTTSGAFSGKLSLAGGRYSTRGQLDATGRATVTISRGLYLTPLAVTFQLDLAGGSQAVWGTVSGGGWSSVLSGDRYIYNARLNPAPQVGQMTFALMTAENNKVSATATGAIGLSGKASIRGALSDGRKLAVSGCLAKQGDYPFYYSLNRGTEVVIGWLNFPGGAAPAPSGTVAWVSKGTNAFAATLRAAALP
jgi:hypothetical protein